MKLRYKNTGTETWGNRFNTSALDEVHTGDDSCIISEMDVFVNGKWKDMHQAFMDKDIITNDYNTWFGVPNSIEDKDRGYFLGL